MTTPDNARRAIDWLARECAPRFMGLVPALQDTAQSLRDSDGDISPATLREIRDAARDAAGESANAARGADNAANRNAWGPAWSGARDSADELFAEAIGEVPIVPDEIEPADAALSDAWGLAFSAARYSARAAVGNASGVAARYAAVSNQDDDRAARDAAKTAAKSAGRQRVGTELQELKASAWGLARRMEGEP